MTSAALQDWLGRRSARLDELIQLHDRATGTGRGRRYGTTEFNRTLVTALVAQFQGYARDLHDLAVEEFVRQIPVPKQQIAIRALLTQGRHLEARTPRRSSLGADFGRLGLETIADIRATDEDQPPVSTPLDTVVDLRNAIGHGREAEILALDQRGYKASKAAFRRYRQAFNALTRTMDRVVADGLAHLLSQPRPW